MLTNSPDSEPLLSETRFASRPANIWRGTVMSTVIEHSIWTRPTMTQALSNDASSFRFNSRSTTAR